MTRALPSWSPWPTQRRLRAERRRGMLSAPVAFEELARSCRMLARARSDLLRDTLQSMRDLL